MLVLVLALRTGSSAVCQAPGARVPRVTVSYDRSEQSEPRNTPSTGCRAAFVADPVTGKVFYEKNAHDRMYPASTTKILTALMVLENCGMNEKAEVSQTALDLVPSGYSSAKLKAGEVFDVETLLYALLIPSANEAANVLAEHVSGSVEAFAALCNRRAAELGCEDLHFVNPNGVHSSDHYCTAYDLYLIARECRKYEVFNRIVMTKRFTVPATDIYPDDDRTFENTDEMIQPGTYYYKYCTGIKTGRTNPAGECFVGSASYNGTELISVVLGGREENSKGLNDRFYDTKRLFEFVYGTYSYAQIARKGETVLTVRVGNAGSDDADLGLAVGADIYAFVPDSGDGDFYTVSFSLQKDISAPVKKGQVLGGITYYADGFTFRTDITATHDVMTAGRGPRYLLWNISRVRH